MAMKLFTDTADVNAIAELHHMGLLDGVTTNPSLIARAGVRGDFLSVIRRICEIVSGPVSVETTAGEASGMVEEGRGLAKLAPNVVVKVPVTWEGMKACRRLSGEGVKVNVTLCFSATQALLAAKAGAHFVSPFVGRLDDLGLDGLGLVREIRTLYDNYGFETGILAASIRSVNHVRDAAIIGADAATIPPGVFRMLVDNALTDKGLDLFMRDWRRTDRQRAK